MSEGSTRADAPLSDRIRLVFIPSSDRAFAIAAESILAEIPADLPLTDARGEFERRLRQHYPAAVVRPRDPLAEFHLADREVWYVTNRTYEFRIAATIDIAATPKVVYGFYVDRFPEWQPAMRLERIGMPVSTRSPALVGTEYAATYELFGRSFGGRFRVVEADPPRSVRVEAEGAGGIRVWYTSSFQASQRGTRIDVFGDYNVPRNLLPAVQGLVLQRVIRRDIDRAHAALRALCERESPSEADVETEVDTEVDAPPGGSPPKA